MKRILTIAILLAASLLASVAHALTPYEKADIIKMARQVISDTGNSFRYYLSEKTVYYDGALTWLVFVDQMPKAGWEHPCKYVYVPAGNPRVDECAVVDSVCPPSDIRIAPIVKINADSDDLVDVKVAEGPETEASGHTYAVILSGGKDINSNSSRYWNDCSFIYKTLTRKYRVPKSNIKVLMSDGTDPADDIHNEVYSLYFSSPLDLDGDGSPDIQYSATKQNLRRVLSEFSGKLGDSDHLFIYVIDHGGSETVNGERQSYICLWGGDKLYPQELDTYLDGIDAGYISFLFGQCHSGGFVRPLQRDNRIIMSSCGDGAFDYSYACEEIPFDEFVYRWTCCVNGYDAYGNLLDNSPYMESDVPSIKTLRYAYSYAVRKDAYCNGEAYVEEKPRISIFENSTAEDLAFDIVPDVCELYITSGEEPTTPRGAFSIMDEDNARNTVPPYAAKPPLRPVYWDSSDIWVRKQNDGMENRTHQNGNLGPDQNQIFVYTKVRNRGVKTYDSNTKQLRLWWARSAMKIDKATWQGKKTNGNKGVYGNFLGLAEISDRLAPGDSTIVCMDYYFTNKYLDYARQEDFNICLLASILENDEVEDDFGETFDDSTLIAKVWDTRRLAQKNLTVLGDKIVPTTVLPSTKNSPEYELRVTTSAGDSLVFKEMNVYLNVSNGSVSEWTPQSKGELSPKAFNPATMSNRVLLSDGCKIGNVRLTGKNTCTLTLSAVTQAPVFYLVDKTYTVNVELYDVQGNRTLGGQSFLIRRNARKKIDFNVLPELDGKGNYMMEVSDPSEPLSYTWKDTGGNVVGTGERCEIPANASSSTYTVEAVAESDGAVRTKDVSLVRIPKIDNVRVVNDAEVAVDFSTPARRDTRLRFSSPTTGQVLCEQAVDEGVLTATVTGAVSLKGVATVSLVENGIVTENVKFVK